MELTVNGKTAFAATGGREFDPGKPTVIFIHGAGMDRTVWQLQTRYFAHHGMSVLAVDLPGHGKSEGPFLDSVPAKAAWIADLVKAAGLKNAHLVGHSMGALIALETAAAHPDTAASIALCGVAMEMPVHPDLLGAAQAGDHLGYDLVTSWGFGRDAHLGGHTSPGLWMTGGGLKVLEQAPAGALGNDLAACNAYRAAPGRGAQVACPALFVLGTRDMMTPAKSGKALAATIEGAQVAELDCGHMMMIEAPDATLDALRDFYRGLKAKEAA